MRYTKEQLEKGKCPLCRSPLRKLEFYQECEVILKSSKPKNSGWMEINDDSPEIHLGERITLEYQCNMCQISFHTDHDTFLAGEDTE